MGEMKVHIHALLTSALDGVQVVSVKTRPLYPPVKKLLFSSEHDAVEDSNIWALIGT